MRLAVLSDTHNHSQNLKSILPLLRAETVETILHCGDVTDPDTLQWLAEFRIVCTFGNGDWNAAQIRKDLLAWRSDNYAATSYQGELDGVKIAAAHGHIPGMVNSLVESRQFAYVFHGHSHRRKDEWIDATRLVNPGALGGLHVETRSFVILDTSSGALTFHQLEN